MSIYRRVLRYYRPDVGPTLVAAALMLGAIGCNLLKVWPMAFVVGKAVPAGLAGESQIQVAFLGTIAINRAIPLLCAAVVVFHLCAGLLNFGSNLIFVKVGLRALLRLRTELYAYLHSLPLKFHDSRRSSDSSFRVAYDSQSIQAFYSKATFVVSSVITLISTFLIIWQLDRQIALVSISIIPFLVGAIRLYAKRIRVESTLIQERESAVLTQAQEGLSSIKMVQAFGREDYEIAQVHGNASESLEANLRFTGTSMRSSLVVTTLMALSTAIMCYLGALHVLDGRLSLTSLVAITTSYLVMLYSPLEALTHLAWALEGAAAAATRCFEVLDREDEVKDAPDAEAIPNANGEIVFENVSFSYIPSHPILANVNLRITPGDTVAFVGATGAGKSTLLSLVPRFYDPAAGRVLLDGRDLRSITKKSLREQISIVLQDTLLFSTTVRENIAYGRPDASHDEIIEAATRAQAHGFITAMPDGYDSQVGERGNHLSVGQRQRIGIARAFLKNAPILLLDEPTSALDATTEAAIMQTIEELMRGRTTLIVTHRIATVHRVGRIVVLAKGGIAEQGTGPDLVQRNGVYAALYRSANLGAASPIASS
jgi:ATP-binding cassette subfamily B protein/subfamily B ATP-binding cassette protein MsbA